MKSCKDCQRTTCNATCLSKKMNQGKEKDPDKRKGETVSDERCRWKGYWCDKYKGKKW